MAMGLPRPRRWDVAAVAVLLVLFAIDLATGSDLLLIVAYGVAPLLASFGTGWRTTGAVGLLAAALAEISRTTSDAMDGANGVVFVATVAVLGALACVAALVRTSREAAARRAGLLSAAGDALGAGGDPRAALAAVAAAAVPGVADRCAIDLTGPGGELERAAAVPGAPPPALEQALARVARGGALELAPRALVIPLAARDDRLGALALGLSSSHRRFGAEDRALAEELAGRCAVALDNARLVAETRAAESELHDAYGLLEGWVQEVSDLAKAA